MTDNITSKAVMALRRLFWKKFRGEITQPELEAEVNAIVGRQPELPIREFEEALCR